MLKYKTILNLMVCVFSIAVLANCQPAVSQELPDIVLKRIAKSDGNSILEGWNETPKTNNTGPYVLTPQNAEFSGARLLHETNLDHDAKSATEKVLKRNGFLNARNLSNHEAVSSFIKTIDGHKNAGVKTLFYEGQLDGQSAKAIAYTWGGKVLCKGEEFCSVVHVFMAPSAQFEALGGGAVIAVAWLEQDVPSGVVSMKRYGKLPAKEATQKLVQYVNSWASSYIQTHVQMMQMMGQNAQIDQQVLDSMQSYNNALSQCGGWDCSISQHSNGIWTATPD